MLCISEVTDPSALFALEPEWRALVDATPGLTPFQTWEWVSAWLRHCAVGVRPLVLLARRAPGGPLCAVLPLYSARYYGTPLRRVRLLGAPLSDYQDMLAPAAEADACRDAFFAYLLEQRGRWDLLDLADLREGTPLSQAQPAGLDARLTHHRKCPYIPLPPTWERFAAGLGKNLRTNLGRRRRQMAKLGQLSLTQPSEAELDQALTDLFYLHNSRWQERGTSGAFSAPHIQRFHRDLALQFLRRGWLRLHLLRLDGKTRAAFYCFQFDRRVYYYLSGFDLELSRYSPGLVLMGHAVESAIKDGATEFDLLRGDESYKYEWQGQDRATQRLLVAHGGLRSRFAMQGSRLERTIEHHGLRWQRRLWGRKAQAKPAAGGPKTGPAPAADGDS